MAIVIGPEPIISLLENYDEELYFIWLAPMFGWALGLYCFFFEDLWILAVGCSLDGAPIWWVDGRVEFVSEGRIGWELDMISVEDDVLKVSITGMKPDGGTVRGYSSPCAAK